MDPCWTQIVVSTSCLLFVEMEAFYRILFQAISEHLQQWGTLIGPRLAQKIAMRAVRQRLLFEDSNQAFS